MSYACHRLSVRKDNAVLSLLSSSSHTLSFAGSPEDIAVHCWELGGTWGQADSTYIVIHLSVRKDNAVLSLPLIFVCGQFRGHCRRLLGKGDACRRCCVRVIQGRHCRHPLAGDCWCTHCRCAKSRGRTMPSCIGHLGGLLGTGDQADSAYIVVCLFLPRDIVVYAVFVVSTRESLIESAPRGESIPGMQARFAVMPADIIGSRRGQATRPGPFSLVRQSVRLCALLLSPISPHGRPLPAFSSSTQYGHVRASSG